MRCRTRSAFIPWGKTGPLCKYFFTRVDHDRTLSWDHVSDDPQSESMPCQQSSFDRWDKSVPEPPEPYNWLCRMASRRTITHSMPKSYSVHLDRIGPAYRLSQVHSKSCRTLSALWHVLLHHMTSGRQAFGHEFRSGWREAERLQAGLLQIRLSLSGSSTTGIIA
jgi:hypothetical protein